MKFYTHVQSMGDKIFVRGYENGKRVEFIEKYKPYLFLPKSDGMYRTLDGKPVDKMQFDSIRDARDFVSRYDEVSNFEYYGLTNFQYVYMYDYYSGEIQYDPSLISVVTIDIECAADEGFPDIVRADKEITAICLRKKVMAVLARSSSTKWRRTPFLIKYSSCSTNCFSASSAICIASLLMFASFSALRLQSNTHLQQIGRAHV